MKNLEKKIINKIDSMKDNNKISSINYTESVYNEEREFKLFISANDAH